MSSSFPEPPRGPPTPVDATASLKRAAVNFAYFPNNSADKDTMKRYGNTVIDSFHKHNFRMDAEATGMAAVTLYLKDKTDPSKRGGTRHNKKRLRKTRKHRKM